MTNRLYTLNKCKSQRVFVGYLTCGFPNKIDFYKNLLFLADNADVVEIGIPFSDPVADGKIIQDCSNIAIIENNIHLIDVLEIVRNFRQENTRTAIVLMGYYNSFIAFGVEKFALEMSGFVDGVIVVDLPFENFNELGVFSENHISIIPLISLTTPPERAIQIIRATVPPFVYFISLLGVTGEKSSNAISDVLDIPRISQYLRDIKQCLTSTMLLIGFGISTPEDAHSILTQIDHVDGVIVGSALLRSLQGQEDSFNELVIGLSKAIHDIPALQHHINSEETPSLLTSVNHEWFISPTSDLGGRYVAEPLMDAHTELSAAWTKYSADHEFLKEVASYRKKYINGPTPLYFCNKLSKRLGGAQVWLKREELAHTGSHKINNAIGQVLLAKRMGKTRIICETGAGQHGVATATACALLDLPCIVYMGATDCERQRLNVLRIQILGGSVIPVSSGSATLKDAINEAMRDWVKNVETTHYVIGSAIGPHPFPQIVKQFQRVIGDESREQFLLENGNTLPNAVIACVGGGSNAIGMFTAFIDDTQTAIYGVEGGGTGPNHNCATLSGTSSVKGVLHGNKTYIMQDSFGNITETHSISAGLDYPAVGPEHSFLRDCRRVQYVSVTDDEALNALQLLSKEEGILPALEPSHALAYGFKLASTMSSDQSVLINMCGRGDKDMHTVAKALNFS